MRIFCWGVDVDSCPGSTYDFFRLGIAKKKLYFSSPVTIFYKMIFFWCLASSSSFVDQDYGRSFWVCVESLLSNSCNSPSSNFGGCPGRFRSLRSKSIFLKPLY